MLPRVTGPRFLLGGARRPYARLLLALAQRLFTADANVRNVKAFFSVKRSKFGARVPRRFRTERSEAGAGQGQRETNAATAADFPPRPKSHRPGAP